MKRVRYRNLEAHYLIQLAQKALEDRDSQPDHRETTLALSALLRSVVTSYIRELNRKNQFATNRDDAE